MTAKYRAVMHFFPSLFDGEQGNLTWSSRELTIADDVYKMFSEQVFRVYDYYKLCFPFFQRRSAYAGFTPEFEAKMFAACNAGDMKKLSELSDYVESRMDMVMKNVIRPPFTFRAILICMETKPGTQMEIRHTTDVTHVVCNNIQKYMHAQIKDHLREYAFEEFLELFAKIK